MSLHPKITLKFKREEPKRWRIYMNQRGLDIPIGIIERQLTGWKSRPTEHHMVYFDICTLWQDGDWSINDLKFKIRMAVNDSIRKYETR